MLVVTSPPWDRELLASGVYMYAPYVPKDLDLETQLKAGELLYYEEGAAATVSVKKLTGTTTLAVDGKTDASNRGDMLTQKLIAHLPLLLHQDPKDVFIIGLGSGMTAGAALTHPIARADVIEISPEVVKASDFFKAENRNALADPRTHLIVGDGRSHLALSNRQVRRDRLRAVESVDRRRVVAVHEGVFRERARAAGAGRHHLPVGQRLQHQRAGSEVDRRDVHLGVSERHGVAGRRQTTCCCWRRSSRSNGAGAASPAKMKRPEVAADLASDRHRRCRSRSCRSMSAARTSCAATRPARRSSPTIA